MSAVRELAKGIELFNVAVIRQLLALFFPNAGISLEPSEGDDALDGAAIVSSVGSLTSVDFSSNGVAPGIQLAFEAAGVHILCDVAAFKKTLAGVLSHSLSTLLGMNEREALLLIADAQNAPVPDEIELIELGARWMRDNDTQLLPFVGRPKVEAFAKRAGIRYVDGESLDNIARLAWELHHEDAWEAQTEAVREAGRGRSLDVIHALRAVGYTIVAPEAEPPATLPTGAVP